MLFNLLCEMNLCTSITNILLRNLDSNSFVEIEFFLHLDVDTELYFLLPNLRYFGIQE